MPPCRWPSASSGLTTVPASSTVTTRRRPTFPVSVATSSTDRPAPGRLTGNLLCERCLTGGQEGRKALPGPAQLVQDALPGRGVQRRIGPGDQVPEHRGERRVLAGQ